MYVGGSPLAVAGLGVISGHLHPGGGVEHAGAQFLGHPAQRGTFARDPDGIRERDVELGQIECGRRRGGIIAAHLVPIGHAHGA